jgi:lysophospholipase L1-like esterase
MLARFMQDVVALKPQVVHILAGTNDIAGNTGPNSPEDYKNTIRAMVTLAQANHIAVVLGSIPPANKFSWQPKLSPAPRIAELNAWLRAFAAEAHAEYVDYYSALAGPDSGLPAKFSIDGVHPNITAYAIMRPLAEAAIGRAQGARR